MSIILYKRKLDYYKKMENNNDERTIYKIKKYNDKIYYELEQQTQLGGTKKNKHDIDDSFEIIFVRHAQTDMNLKKIRYDNFGKDEYYPITEDGKKMAEETGKFLKKYGTFDTIISSPRDRCVQTAEHILKYIDCKSDIVLSDLLLESNAGKLNLMNSDEVKAFMAKNKKLLTLSQKIKDETNEFEKMKLMEKYIKKIFKYTGQTDMDALEVNYKEFLDNTIKLNHKRILAVCHRGTIYQIVAIICNIGYGMDIDTVPSEYTTSSKNKHEIYFNGNCIIMGLLYKNGSYKIIIPPNNLHLEKMAKEQQKHDTK